MILKASQRGGGRQLAAHLLNAHDNEHVSVHELRGFAADDLGGAFQEAYATSKATKAKQFLFSVSFNPPKEAEVKTETFEAAINALEKKLGLDDQPRAIVFHEKDGRRHAHAVWSRIDTENMRAVPMSFFKSKCRDLGREIFIEQGWKLPRGYINSKERDPASYTLAEWQQAKRAGVDPKALKSMFQECWAASDSAQAFASALKLRGYTLARGDRRGHVAVDYRGEVYAIARYTGVRTKSVLARLGDPDSLPSVDEAKAEHAGRMTEMLRRHLKDAEDRRQRETEKLAARRNEIVERQRHQRAELQKQQQTRLATETRERTRRFSRGFRGLWDRFTGKHSKIKEQNEQEAQLSAHRDKIERDKLTFRQIGERQFIHNRIKETRTRHTEQVVELQRDIAGFGQTRERDPPRPGERDRSRDRDLERD